MAMAITTEESSYCDPDCWMRRAGWSWPVVQGGICRFCLSAGKGASGAEGTQGNGGGISEGHGSNQSPFRETATDLK